MLMLIQIFLNVGPTILMFCCVNNSYFPKFLEPLQLGCNVILWGNSNCQSYIHQALDLVSDRLRLLFYVSDNMEAINFVLE